MSYARANLSTTAQVNDNVIFGTGAFKYVYAGTYTSGPRNGQPCVSKEFKSGCVVEEHYFQEELNICAKAQTIIDAFNEKKFISQEIYLNTPRVWTYQPGSSKSGQKCLVEPMILNFEKFNSNSGWVMTDSTGWGSVMQALSHFSYHHCGGQFLLCDLQGGRYKDGFVLSDPVIMSMAQNRGPADLGVDGIRSFFQRHQCGPFCDKSWSKPTVVSKAVIPMKEGTTMQAYLPTRNSRVPLSRLGSVLE